jgi:hypothetical protein
MRRIGGFTFITSPNLPTAGTATLLDSTVFGSFVDEYLQGEGYVSDGVDNLQVKTDPLRQGRRLAYPRSPHRGADRSGARRGVEDHRGRCLMPYLVTSPLVLVRVPDQVGDGYRVDYHYQGLRRPGRAIRRREARREDRRPQGVEGQGRQG